MIFEKLRLINKFRSTLQHHGIREEINGKVDVDITDSTEVFFFESGVKHLSKEQAITFSNTYFWKQKNKHEIQLFHLRRGKNNPVHLVDFSYSHRDKKWTSQSPHLCGDDRYHATLIADENVIILSWDIQGPYKDIQIQVEYCVEAIK